MECFNTPVGKKSGNQAEDHGLIFFLGIQFFQLGVAVS